jgi:hypothetical protein
MWPFIESNAAAMGMLSDCAAPPSSVVIEVPASFSVTSWRPLGRGIGSSKGRFQPAISRHAAV